MWGEPSTATSSTPAAEAATSSTPAAEATTGDDGVSIGISGPAKAESAGTGASPPRRAGTPGGRGISQPADDPRRRSRSASGGSWHRIFIRYRPMPRTSPSASRAKRTESPLIRMSRTPRRSTIQSPSGVRSSPAWNAETLGSVSRNLHPWADPIRDITRFIGQMVACDGPLRNSSATSGSGSRPMDRVASGDSPPGSRGPGSAAGSSPAARRITNGPTWSRPTAASQPHFRVPVSSQVPVRLSRSTQKTCPATAWM